MEQLICTLSYELDDDLRSLGAGDDWEGMDRSDWLDGVEAHEVFRAVSGRRATEVTIRQEDV